MNRPSPDNPTPGDRSVRHLLRSLAYLVLAAGLVVGLGWLMQARLFQPTPTVTLPSGEVISVRAVSYGTLHPAPTRFPLEHRFPKALVEFLQRNAGYSPPPPPVTTADPRLVVWLRVSGPAATNALAPARFAIHLAAPGSAADKEPLWGPVKDMMLFGSGSLIPVEFEAFPRRQGPFALWFYPPSYISPRALIGSLPANLPAAATAPAWTAEPLPVTHTNGPLECTLTGFLGGTGKNSGQIATADGRSLSVVDRAPPGEVARATIQVQFRDTSAHPSQWTLGPMAVADASGNLLVQQSSSSSQLEKQAGLTLAWSPVLWPDDIWELRFDARRTLQLSSFAPEERIVLENVPLPEVGETNYPGVAGTAQGTTLTLLEIVRRPPISGDSWSSSSLSNLRINARGLDTGVFLDLLSMTDERGRVFQSDSRSENHGPPSTPREFGFGFTKLDADARSVRIEFVVHRGIPFTFRIDPRVVVTNASLGWEK